ncbi:copper chaperone PCu(A)C [Marinobacter sp.]|uniref:copper chaperone PCu(A)C n=1 Tax=Marinobacter sp. TaxID=50741 RepID=UPI001A04E0D3|nr:copper chaperone PCu(A)C [Marinobacter sp.]MBE0487407.1 copper chaperone PCu(A)C [Marinobacter sp.]
MNQLKIWTAAALLSSALFCMPAMAGDHGHHHHHHPGHSQGQNSIQVNQPWSRPTPPGTPVGVGYLVITNSGDQDVTLIAAESPRAGRVSIHETRMHQGMMRMQPLKDGLTVPAGGSVELKPHSYHLMLEQLAQPLVEGEAIPVRLDFDVAEAMDIELKVRSLDNDTAIDHSGMHH